MDTIENKQHVLYKIKKISNKDIDFINFYNRTDLSEDDDTISLSSLSNDELGRFKSTLSNDITKQSYDNGKRIIYKCLIKTLIEALDDDEIIFSENNRMVDEDRLKNFRNFESIKCDPIILGERLDKNSKYDIIDGQHRITFLKNLDKLSESDKNRIMKEYIPLDIRVCYDESDFKSYIDSTNNRKIFSSDQLRSFKYPILRDLLNKEFKTDIFTISYIKINEELFKSAIFKTKYFENFNNTAEIIANKIKAINLFFKQLNDKSKLSPDRDISKKSYIKEYEKAKKMNLFLGMDQKLNWFILLDYEEEDWTNIWSILFVNRKTKRSK